MSWDTGDGASDWKGGGGGTVVSVASAWETGINNSAATGYEGGATSFDNNNANGYGDGDGAAGAGGGDRACFNCGEGGYVSCPDQTY